MPVTKLVIKTNAAESTYVDKYVVTSKFMHGDGDFNVTVTNVVPGNRPDVVIDFLNWLSTTGDAIKRREYMSTVPGYARFGDIDSDEFEYGLEDGWPINCMNSVQASYRGSTVAFYDINGTQFEVSTV